jgi:hypothetical protein
MASTIADVVIVDPRRQKKRFLCYFLSLVIKCKKSQLYCSFKDKERKQFFESFFFILCLHLETVKNKKFISDLFPSLH